MYLVCLPAWHCDRCSAFVILFSPCVTQVTVAHCSSSRFSSVLFPISDNHIKTGMQAGWESDLTWLPRPQTVTLTVDLLLPTHLVSPGCSSTLTCYGPLVSWANTVGSALVYVSVM